MNRNLLRTGPSKTDKLRNFGFTMRNLVNLYLKQNKLTAKNVKPHSPSFRLYRNVMGLATLPIELKIMVEEENPIDHTAINSKEVILRAKFLLNARETTATVRRHPKNNRLYLDIDVSDVTDLAVDRLYVYIQHLDLR